MTRYLYIFKLDCLSKNFLTLIEQLNIGFIVDWSKITTKQQLKGINIAGGYINPESQVVLTKINQMSSKSYTICLRNFKESKWFNFFKQISSPLICCVNYGDRVEPPLHFLSNLSLSLHCKKNHGKCSKKLDHFSIAN